MALLVGVVKQMNGLVMAKNAMGEERVLAVGDTIHMDESISTLGAGSKALLSLADGRDIALRGNDSVMVDESVHASAEGFGHDAVVTAQTLSAVVGNSSVSQIQEALLRGEDISELEATAAGETGTSTASSLMSGFATARYVTGGNESSVESSQRSIDETPNNETPLILTDTQATQATTSISEVITDTTPPDSSKLAITNIVDNTGNYASVTISGTGAKEGNTITLYDEDNNVVATAIIQADGTWNADISNLPNTPVGDNEFFKVTETDASGNTTAQSTAVHYYHGAGTGAYTEQTDDFVLLGDGNDLVYTDSASPIAYRDDSNDTLVIDGGNGNDTVLFGKNASEYTITTTASGSILVSENVSSDSNGDGVGDVTELRNVEKLQFLDGAYYPYNTAATLSVTTVTTFVEDASSNGVGSVVAHYSTSDVDGDSVSVNLSDTTHYALDGSGNVTLTAAGVALVNAGSDLPAFTLTPNDGKTLGSAVSIDPNVTVVNDAPIASASSDSVNEDALSVSITPVQGGVNLLAGLSDEDTSSGHSIAQISSDNSHYTAVSSSGTLIKVGFSYTNAEGATSTIYLPVKINADGSYAISQSELLNAIPEGQSATGSFWYTISDGETTNNLSTPQQFTMTILGQNDAPEVNVTTLETTQINADIPVMVKLSGDRFNTSTGDAPKFNIYVDGVKLNDSPLSVEEFRSYNISSSLGSVARQISYEYVTFDVAQGTKSIAIEFVQDAYEGGSDTDGDGYSEDRNLIVDSITIGGTVSTGANGTLQISGGVTLQAEDKSVSSYIASGVDRSGTETMAWNGKMTFNVENVVAGATSNASFQTENFNEDVVSQTDVTGSVSLLNGATDVDGKTSDLTISQADGSSFSAPIVVTLTTSTGLTFDVNVTLNSNGAYSIAPNSALNALSEGIVATGSFDFYIKDANGGVSEKQTFTMNVEGKNDAPIAVNDTYTLSAGLEGSYYVYHQGSDGENLSRISQVENFVAQSTPDATFMATSLNFGSVSGNLAANGKLSTFLGDNAQNLSSINDTGTDAIIKLSGTMSLSAGTYYVRVTSDDGYALYIDGKRVSAYDNNRSVASTNGQFTIDSSGMHEIDLVYWDQGGVAALKVEFSTDGISYHVLNNVEDSFVGSLATIENTSLTIESSTFLHNDTDIDDDSLSLFSVTNSTHGTVALVDGNVLFTPETDYNGEATFTYTLSDSKGGLVDATATIMVIPQAITTSIGTNNSDTLNGGAGVDQLYGGNGNDIFVYDSADSVIHGGNGVDTLLFSHDATVDLSGIADGKIESIEVLDLTKASVELSINPADVLHITDDSNTILKILGGSDDTLHGTGWTQTTGADAGFTRFENSDHSIKMDVQDSIVHTDF